MSRMAFGGWIALSALLLGQQVSADPAPFATRNQSPVARLFGVPTAENALPSDAPGFRAAVALDTANQSHQNVDGNRELVLDGETWTLRSEIRHEWANGWRLAMEIPYVVHWGGVWDRIIMEYHDVMNLPQGNRKFRSTGRVDYSYREGSRMHFATDESTAGLGDVRLSVAIPLAINVPRTRGAYSMAGIELPTGDPDDLLGSGSTDVRLGLAASDRATLSRWGMDLHASGGMLAMTTGEVLPDHQKHLAAYGSASLGWRMTPRLHPRVQLDWHSPIFSGTGMKPLDSWAVELVVGGRIRLPGGFRLDVAFAEDLNVSASPDITFHFRLEKQM